MQAGLGIVTYVPNAHPVGLRHLLHHHLRRERSGRGVRRGARDDLSALPVLPRGVQEVQRRAAWRLDHARPMCSPAASRSGRWPSSRASASAPPAATPRCSSMAGMVPVGATLVEAVGLLQRGGLDCQHGIHDWLRTFGYADVAKYVMDYPLGLTGPAIGMFMNRDTWKSFTPEQKKIHLKHARLAERQDGDRQLHRLQRGRAQHRDQGQGRAAGQGRQRLRSGRGELQEGRSATPISPPPRTSASRIRPRSSTTTSRRSSAGGRSRRRSAATSTSSPTRSNREVFSKIDPEKL